MVVIFVFCSNKYFFFNAKKREGNKHLLNTYNVLGASCHMVLLSLFTREEAHALWQAQEPSCSQEEEMVPGWALAGLGLESVFYHKCYKLNLLLVSDILEGVSTQGHFGLSAISARGCYGQARSLAVNQKVRLTLTVLTDQEEEQNMPAFQTSRVIPLGSTSSGF